VEQAWRAGIVVVAAGSEDRNNAMQTQGHGAIASPGNDPYVITVGAMKTAGTAGRGDEVIAPITVSFVPNSLSRSSTPIEGGFVDSTDIGEQSGSFCCLHLGYRRTRRRSSAYCWDEVGRVVIANAGRERRRG